MESFTVPNDLGVDPAIAPATLLAGFHSWRPRRALLWATALPIAVPAFAFFRWTAITEPAGMLPLLDHVALLMAGALAVVSVLRSVVPMQPRSPHSRPA